MQGTSLIRRGVHEVVDEVLREVLVYLQVQQNNWSILFVFEFADRVDFPLDFLEVAQELLALEVVVVEDVQREVQKLLAFQFEDQGGIVLTVRTVNFENCFLQ